MSHAFQNAPVHSKRIRTLALVLIALLFGLGTTQTGHAFESLFKKFVRDRSLTSLFGEYQSRAHLEDDFMIGTGTEHLRTLPDGNLSIVRKVFYTHVRRNDTRAVAKLPEPWSATGTYLLSPTLRVIHVETTLQLARSGDTVFPDYKLSDHHEWLFKFDKTVLHAHDQGRRLQRQELLRGKVTKNETYDYPANAAPMEIIGLYMALAVQRGIDQFDFDLLEPGGDLHGIRSRVYRTNDVRRFSEGYDVPKDKLISKEPLAVVDMRLASPIKYMFFPHHFYMAFSARDPSKLMMVWGGDPSAQLQAFRMD